MSGWSTVNKESAYWSGFMAADGYFFEGREGSAKRPAVVLALAEKDRSHVQRFLDFVGSSRRPYYLDNNGYGAVRVDLYKEAPALIQQIKDNFGFTFKDGKDFSLERIPSNHRIDFLVGFIDGDGSVIWKDGEVLAIQMFGPEKLIQDMKEFISDLVPPLRRKSVKPGVTPLKNGFIYRLQGPRARKLAEIVRERNLPVLARKWIDPSHEQEKKLENTVA